MRTNLDYGFRLTRLIGIRVWTEVLDSKSIRDLAEVRGFSLEFRVRDW